MSVFNDFQRLWMQKFPQNSLSDAWVQDVRASLDRHKLKIVELKTELEQETLYVEYLEHLLSDVEKVLESGGDPATLLAATATSREDEDAGSVIKSSLNLRESVKQSDDNNAAKDKTNRLSLNTDNKYTTNTATSTAGSAAYSQQAPLAAVKAEDEGFKDAGTEKDRRNNGALHQQCITELTASFSSTRPSDGVETAEAIKPPIKTAAKPSQFITVIEVNETKKLSSADQGDADPDPESNSENASSSAMSSFSANRVEPASPSPLMSASSYSAHMDAKKKMPPRPPPKNIRRVEPPTVPGGAPLSSSPKRENPFVGSAMPLPNASSSFSSDSSGNSLERNIKPSEILRQMSENAEGVNSVSKHSFAANRKTNPDFNRNASHLGELIECPDTTSGSRKIGKSESLEKTKRSAANSSESPTGSLGRTISTPVKFTAKVSPTSSLSKSSKLAADSSSTGSLDKKSQSSLQTGCEGDMRNIGSKESIASHGICEIIKSYESVSSLSSDSAKGIQATENEPYYDTVPLDSGDGEYVFIKPGGNAGGAGLSSSSRDDLSTTSSIQAMGNSNMQMNSQTSVTDPESPGRTSTYVNIDYFLQPRENRSSSMDSDGECEGPPTMRPHQEDSAGIPTPVVLRKNLVSAILVSGNKRGQKIRSMLNSIIRSETNYVECLNKMIQYRRCLHATQSTSQPVIREDEENTIFYKIDELHSVHTAFLDDLKQCVAHEGGDVLIGETFKRIADMFDLYSAFLHNYGRAVDMVKKCSASNSTFKESVSSITVKIENEKVLSLEDLLHKPVARVQYNALVFDDLLLETPSNHPDHQPLRQASNTIRMFLNQFNVVKQGLPNETNKNLRRVVKNSFIVELVDGHRKLRHLFLFNDVIACAKHKAYGRDRIEYELKWFIPMKDVHIEEADSNAADLKESSPANILQLKTMACTVRDELLAEEKEERARKTNGLRAGDKIRRKLADLESKLVLASPNLVFRITNKITHKSYTFFLSSDYERTHWIESITSLKQTCDIPGASVINALEVNAFILAMQKGMKLEMGSYLMRNNKDESLLVGDLHFTIEDLSGIEQPGDFYICLEIDSYGHYFRKATTKMICRSKNPLWNESFVLELEGSLNVRVLLYEVLEHPRLRAKTVVKLSRSWLRETDTPKVLRLSDGITLKTVLKFVPGEVTLRRVPTSKPGALFGAKMNQVLKREKRDIPFIISACIREVERRGMSEVGIYRVSGSASDLLKLKKSFETNAYEAEQLLKDVDIHSVTGILKSYLRELPEALFTDVLYPRLFETYNTHSNISESARISDLLVVFEELPQANKASINHILDHLIRVHRKEVDNKMSLHNLAMVFGPTLLRPGQTQTKQKDQLASSTVDVMAQAGILYCFLQARLKKD